MCFVIKPKGFVKPSLTCQSPMPPHSRTCYPLPIPCSFPTFNSDFLSLISRSQAQMLVFVKLWRWWWFTIMELSRWLLVVLLEAFNGNFFVCVDGGFHRSALFYNAFIVMLLMRIRSYYFSIVHLVCYASLVHLICYASLVHLFLLFFCCMCTCSCCASIVHLLVLCLLAYLFLLHPCCALIFVVPLLHMHLFLLRLCCTCTYSCWPLLRTYSYCVALHLLTLLGCCSVFDLLTLLF